MILKDGVKKECPYLHHVAAGAGLYRDVLTRLEGCEDFWVQLDAEVLLFDNSLVPLLDLLIDPILEDGADDGVDHVGDVLTGQLEPLTLLFRKCLHHRWEVEGVEEHGLDLQALEVRHLDMLHLGGLDLRPLAHGYIT